MVKDLPRILNKNFNFLYLSFNLKRKNDELKENDSKIIKISPDLEAFKVR